MGHSYKNTSNDGMTKGNTGAHYLPIKDNVDPKPPAGASNSYESVRKQIDSKDSTALARGPYTREKMRNK